MRHSASILTLCIIALSCTNSSNDSLPSKVDSEDVKPPMAPPIFDAKIFWVDSSKAEILIDTSLSYKKNNIHCDSVIALDYIGFEGEHFYLPVNSKGQWINTVKKRQKLTKEQEMLITKVLGDKKSFRDPLVIPCFQPNLAFVYYKNGKIIGQISVCLGCAGLQTTIGLGSPPEEGGFNEKARQKLNTLCKALSFSECID